LGDRGREPQTEGKADQAAATVKEKVEDAKGKLAKVVDKAKDRLSAG
jgi:uncharacterized protein YjbJ (UPF0337 family)